MIFITLGSQKFQFNRLLRQIDSLIEKGVITEKVFAQIGASDYVPQFFSYTDYMDKKDFIRYVGEADIVITHGGTGAIINAVSQLKKVIAVPRLAKYGEHVDDHQIQIIKQFEEMRILYPCYSCEDLEKAIKEIRTSKFVGYRSNTKNLIGSIEEYLESLQA